MQFASNLPSLEPSPRPPASAFGLVTGVNHVEAPSGWLQVPPTHMLWGNPAAHEPSIVRFTAEPLDKPGPSGLNVSPFGQCKRKIDPEMPMPMPKQLITEEKMAAHMRQLHISNSYTSHDEPVMGTMPAKPLAASDSAPSVTSEQQSYKRLVMCEELRQLQHEPILPPSLLSRMPRPSMALVLWNPPAGKVHETLSQAAASAALAEEEEQRRQAQGSASFSSVSLNNNNSAGAVDLNSMHRFGHSYSSLPDTETMDL